MRIDNNTRVAGTTGRSSASRSGSGAAFEVDLGTRAQEARATAGTVPVASLDALLALQAVEDPLARRRKLARRGSQLVDTLESMRADLLAGRVSEGSLNQLMALMSQARERSEPELDALLDEIELRARVELAKRGLYLD